ncbi:MAG: hypothetical protein NTU41_09150, partial [Chloroflexi bacterium]|nr:hypothetical protein [Chloroflexota bacterium]
MAGIPSRGKERWQIAVAHGQYAEGADNEMRSFQISGAEIADSHRDYVALGHCGPFRCVCENPVKAYYSGPAAEAGMVAIVDFVGDKDIRVTP